MSSTLFLVASLSLLLAPTGALPSGPSGSLEGLSDALVAHGFENVLVSGEPGTVVHVYYENRIYRYHLRAMGVVLALVHEELAPTWTVDLVPMVAGVPIVSVTARADDYIRFISGEVDDSAFAQALAIHTDPPVPDLGKGRNPSFRRLDLSAGPSFTVEFEEFDDSLLSQFNIVPQAEAALTKGVFATGQVIVPVIDEVDEETSGVRPGRVTLDWLHRRWGGVGLFRAGLFDPERYGASLGAGRWAWGDRLLLTARGDLTGKLALVGGVWEYSSADVFTYALEAQYWYPLLDVTVKAGFGRFLGEEQGGRLDLSRMMGELAVGFFAMKTKSVSLAGILVDVPLPMARHPKPSPVRLRTVPAITWEYRDTVTRAGRMPGGGLSIERLYKGLAPTFIRNNVSEWREAQRFI